MDNLNVYQHKWLPCTIENGMFDTEYSVEIEFELKKYSLFADKSNVKNGNGNKGLLSVTLLKIENNHGTIMLPDEVLELGFRIINVPMNILQ